MSDSIISYWRDARGPFRGVTALVLASFIWMQIYPVAATAKDVIQENGADPTVGTSTAFSPVSESHRLRNTNPQRATLETLSKTLNSMHVALKRHRDLIIKRKDLKGNLHITILGTKADVDLTRDRKELGLIRQQLASQDLQAEAAFQRDDDHIKAYHLPMIIQQRHDDAVTKYQRNHDIFQKGLDVLEQSRDLNALLSQTEELRKQVAGDLPRQAKLDPKNLPFRTVDSKVREPATTQIQLQKLLSFPVGASARTSQNPTLSLESHKQGINAAELALIKGDGQPFPYLKERRGVMVASVGSMSGLMAMGVVLPATDTLTPNEDVQITPAIQALAAQLHNNPVEIYNWVHNNIKFIPSYGSIQGSQMTLDKMQGNAFDTSSLLIALLRAANIPARYVYGTIEVPADKANNWVGGTTSPDATQQLLGQGGIPNSGLTKGGETVAIRMEHVWVEAYVDAYPSRGARNFAADAWMPMDGSFKQYAYTQGMNLQQNVPFDVASFINNAQSSATVDSVNGYVQNLNKSNIQSAVTSYQSQIESYINSQNPGATIGQVYGTKTIVPTDGKALAAGLPYRLGARASAFSTIPSGLRHQFQYALYVDANSVAAEDPFLSYQASATSLAGKKITLVFVPTATGDEQALESYLPKPHPDGSSIQPGEFPQSLPGYLINMTPQIRVDGQIVASGGSFAMGTSLIGRGGFTTMNLLDWDITSDAQVAGQSSALGLSLQGISGAQLGALNKRMQDTKDQLQGNQLSGLSGENISGDLLTSTIWSYFSEVESFGAITQKQAGIIDEPGLSYGFVHAQIVPIQTYGISMRVNFPGVLMDVGHERRLAYSKNNNQQIWIKYNRIRGQHASLMEVAVPQQVFLDPNNNSVPQGVSAETALAVAASQGQKIYTLTQANRSQLSNIQQSSSVINEIGDSLNAGMEVTVAQQPVTIGSWTGTGYIVTDPQTGAGAYLIEGGARGGQVNTDAITSLMMAVGNVADYFGTLLSAIKSILVEILDHENFSIVDLVASLAIDTLKLSDVCKGDMFYLTVGTAILFTLLGFVATATLALPLLFSVLFVATYSVLYDILVEQMIETCTVVSRARLPRRSREIQTAGLLA